ncbi:Ig-like domain repeat protein [Nocardioides sp. MAHUQ-72]|uniref:Ig-like domain repeat protein n=1 Tax=unclassified Nocardioides TaxID=2615069 RepID=UPI00360DB5F4
MFRSRVLTLAMGLVLATGVVAGSVVTPPSAQAAAPEAPTGLTPAGGAVIDGSVTLGWDRPAGVTKFDVQIAATADFASPLVSQVGTTNIQYVPTVQLPAGDLWWRVRSTNGTETSDWSTETFERGSDDAPVPIRPTAGTDTNPPVIKPPVDSPRFAWKPVAGATSYTVQVGTDRQFTDPALITASTQRTTAAVLTGYQPVGYYYWRVSAALGSGYATPWSDAIRYQVKGLDAARLTAPADSFDPVPGSDPEEWVRDVILDWDPVPGAATYQLQVSTDDAFMTMVDNVSGIVGTRYSPPGTYNNDEYYWRVRPVDASGNAAEWPATPWKFRRAWPEQLALVYPTGDLTGSTTPFFYQWDAIERASKYTVYLYKADGTQVCKADTVQTTLANTCKPAVAGDYTWKVLATDDGGPARPVTDLIAQPGTAFHYEPVPAPAGSGPLTVDMVTGHAASMSGTTAYGIGGSARDACGASLPDTCVDLRQTPILTWDPVPGAVKYKLTLARDSELTNVISTEDVTDPIWTPSTTMPDSQAGSAYFWVVQPCWGSSTSLCAPLKHAEHSFAKKTIAPHLISPVETVVNGVLTPPVVEDDVTLDWSTELAALRDPTAMIDSSLTTPASTEAKSYVVQTSIDPSFSSTLESATVDQTTFTSFANTYPEGPIYWRVRALDGSGNPTVWSATGQFEKRSPVPVLTTPAPGGTLGADYTLSWDPLPFAAAYEVEVYAGPTKVGGVASWKHASWAPSDPFPVSPDGYTWRVRRIDAKGRKGDWSKVRRFFSDGVVPSTVAPADGAVVAPSTSYFAWEPDARATSYRFERRKAGTTTLTESVSTRSTAWAPTSTIAAGSWEWRVVALDAKSVSLGASPWQGFTVVDPPAVAVPVGITGSGKVGTELRLTAPVFDPVVDQTSYQWFRGTSAITGATGHIYTVSSADLGKAITVRATGTLDGYKPATSTSAAITGVAGDALVAVYPPSVVGQPAVGQTLTVDKGTWPDNPRLTYTWFRDGTAIPGATSSTYRLVTADAGRPIHVVETATLTGREPGTATSGSLAVAKLRSTTTLVLSTTRATVKQRVTATVKVAVSGLSAPGGSVTIFDGTRKLTKAQLGTGTTATVRLSRLAKGKHVIKAVYSGAAQAKPSSGKAKLTITRR